MPVTLHLPTVLAKLADGRVLDAEGDTVGAVVADVASRFPALAPRLRDEGLIKVAARSIAVQDATRLEEMFRRNLGEA